ncbi:hypothetical protein [Streptomyces sp. NPDC003717]|uniref:hypothetical protein n=1 Tax=Streptomyces sp. NPDC003717 TaxID=3154276 RepID=UPI0033B4A21C
MAPDEAVVGCTGRLTLATRGTEGPGEVLVRVRGGTETFFAYSDEPLERGTTVLVIESLGHREVSVIVWSDPLLDPPSGGDTRGAR